MVRDASSGCRVALDRLHAHSRGSAHAAGTVTFACYDAACAQRRQALSCRIGRRKYMYKKRTRWRYARSPVWAAAELQMQQLLCQGWAQALRQDCAVTGAARRRSRPWTPANHRLQPADWTQLWHSLSLLWLQLPDAGASTTSICAAHVCVKAYSLLHTGCCFT